MSAIIFPHARGTVKRVRGPWERPSAFRVTMQGWNFRQRAIITQAAVVQNGNFQFLHTLNDQIFVYVFGDRISELQIGGIAFGTFGGFLPNFCSEEGSGTEDVFPFYRFYRVANRAEPILIRTGPSAVFRGFLTGMHFEVADPESMLGHFSFRFHSFPTDQ